MIDIQQYKEAGYLLLKKFFEPFEIDAIREEAQSIFIEQMLRLGIVNKREISPRAFDQGMFEFFAADVKCFTNCGKQSQHLISLHRLSLEVRLVATLKALGLQAPNISTRPVLYFNSSRLAEKEVYWRLSLHQDWRSMQGSLDAVVVWIPLIDIDRSLGALEIIPGSHRWGLLEADLIDGYGHIKEQIDQSSLIAIELEKGDALFFSAFLAHRSGTNSTDSIRWSCHFRYNNLREPTFIKRGFPHPYIYKPQEELITEHFPEREEVENLFR